MSEEVYSYFRKLAENKERYGALVQADEDFAVGLQVLRSEETRLEEEKQALSQENTAQRQENAALRQENAALMQELAALRQECARIMGQLSACEQERARVQTIVDATLSSTSWRITGPLRSLVTFIASARRHFK